MNEGKEIRKFLWRARATVFLLAFARGMLRAIPVTLAGLVVWSGLDYWLLFPPFARLAAWGILMAVGLWRFGTAFWPFEMFRLRSLSRSLAAKSKGKEFRPDELEISEQLQRSVPDGISNELHRVYLSSVAESFGRASPAWCFPWMRWRPLVGSAIVLSTVSGLLWAFMPVPFSPMRVLIPGGGYEIRSAVRVAPGNADVDFGSAQTVTVDLLKPSVETPVLHLWTSDAWVPLEPLEESGNRSSYFFNSVTSELRYRVRWKNQWSEAYTLRPVKPVGVKEFRVTVMPPAYLPQNAQIHTSPEIRGVAGSRVTVEADLDAPVRSATARFSNEAQTPAQLLGPEKIQFQFHLTESGFFRLEFIDRHGKSVAAEHTYPIWVDADDSPTITLLSPEEDLVADPNEKIPLTYEAKDDFGIQKIELVWTVSSSEKRKTLFLGEGGAPEATLDTFYWSLSRERFRAGDKIRFHLAAEDANTVTGPGRGVSAARIIEIASFEQGHEKIEKSLEEWRNQAVDYLADVNVAQQKTVKQERPMEELASDFAQLAQASRRLGEDFDSIVQKMELDPLVDYAVLLEHRAIQESLRDLHQGPQASAQAAFQTKNAAEAGKQLEYVSSEMERLIALSEELSKEQRARDVRDSGNTLEELGEEIKQELEDARPSGDNAAIRDRIAQLLADAQKELMEMARALTEMPQSLPEDFVNQQALKNIDLGKSQDALSKIAEAMKAGNWDQALAMAESFLRSAQELKKQLSKAHDSFLETRSAEGLADEINEKQEKLQAIIDAQTAVLTETQKLEKKRLEALLNFQKKQLESLAEQQKKAIGTMDRLVQNTAVPESARLAVARVLPAMREVAVEFSGQTVNRSGELLTGIVQQLDQIMSSEGKEAAHAAEVRSIRNIEEEVRLALENTEAPDPFTSEDARVFGELKGRQSGIAEDTVRLLNEIKTLSRRTAGIGTRLTQSIVSASNEMKSAASELGNRRSQTAQRHEEAALRHLQDGKEQLMQSSEMMAAMGAGRSGGGAGGSLRVMPAGARDGRGGTSMGNVKLPTVEDYRPPKEFREELLESFREKYPEIYEDIVHRYYKSLSD